MNVHRISLLFLSLTWLLLTGCAKGDDVFFYKGSLMPVTLTGYNGSNQMLQVQVDTFMLPSIGANVTFSQSSNYLFPDNRDSVKLKVFESGTGKIVLEKIVRKEDKIALFNFFYMDGKVGDMPQKPEAQDGKIRITWLFRPTITKYAEPVDIVIGKYYFTPKVFEEITRLKNVKPNEFSEVITLQAPLFTTPGLYNGQNTAINFRAYIYKAGTNEFYTQGTSYTWDASSTAPVPSAQTASAKLYIFSENFTGTAVRYTKQLEL